MKVRLNLASTPLENHRQFAIGVTLVGMLAISAFVLLGMNALYGWRANRALRQEISQLEQELKRNRELRRELESFFKQPETREIVNRGAFLNGLIEQRSFPWTKIFSDLERMLPEGVRVVSIAPQMQDGRVEVKLTIGASTDSSKIEFLKTLEAAPEFTHMRVGGESRPRDAGGGDVVVLELTVLYDSGAQSGQTPVAAMESNAAVAKGNPAQAATVGNKNER
jgi:Tfp pilus assembly protein PilN